MRIELLYSPYCPACRDAAAAAAAARGDDVTVRDITRWLEYAAGLGVTELPALIVGGRLRAQGAAAIRALAQTARDGQAP